MANIKFECECGKKFETPEGKCREDFVYSLDEDNEPVPGKSFYDDCPACGSECCSEGAPA